MEELINYLQILIYGKILFYKQINGLWYSREEDKYINTNRLCEIIYDEIKYVITGD